MAELSDNVNSVQKLVPVEMFLALNIVDGEGNKTNRIVFRADGMTDFQFLFPGGGKHEGAVPRMAKWTQDALQQLAEHVEADSIPETKVSVPVGAPDME